MATNSLSRMTVPLSSAVTDGNGTQGLLMPKLKYRFRVILNNFGIGPTTELTKQVVDFTRPNVTFENIDLPIYNSTIKLAGKYSWADVTCNIRDDASGFVTSQVGEQLQKQLDFAEMSSAAAGNDYKFTTTFQVLDGGNGATPGILETWTLLGCYLQGVNYGDANYGSNEAMQLALTIRFDNALQGTQENPGPGVGAPNNFARALGGGIATGVGVAQ
jgi:hypothetical protein